MPANLHGSARLTAGLPFTLHDIESSLWRALLALARAFIALYLARVAARPRATDYMHDGAKFVLVGRCPSGPEPRWSKSTAAMPCTCQSRRQWRS
jgi:hypothetical protein